jgi:hypothetical protein
MYPVIYSGVSITFFLESKSIAIYELKIQCNRGSCCPRKIVQKVLPLVARTNFFDMLHRLISLLQKHEQW